MTKEEIKIALKNWGVSFANNASEETLRGLYEAKKAEEITKKIEELGGFSFDSEDFQRKLKEAKEREFPDFGRDVPEGEYIFTGKGTSHIWKSPRTGRESEILTSYIANENGDIFEVALAAFAAREWPFVQFNGRNNEGKASYKEIKVSCPVAYTESTSDRNAKVASLAARTKIKVCHARGHFDNPYNSRIFDFTYTWVELA